MAHGAAGEAPARMGDQPDRRSAVSGDEEADSAVAGDTGARHLAGMARGGSLNLIGAVCSQLALLAVTVLLARMLGRVAVGSYAQSYAFLSLLGLLSLSGFRAGMTRFVAVHLADDDRAGVRGTIRLGLWLTSVSSTVLGAGLALAAPMLADAFNDPALVTGLRLVGLSLPAATFTDAALAATQGWRTMGPYALIGGVFTPLARLALTGTLMALGFGLSGAFLALAVSSWLGALLAGAALWWRLRGMRAAEAEAAVAYEVAYHPRELFAFSTVSWAASLASTGLIWADTIVLGLLRDSGDVGVYNVATRLVTLAVFVMAPINAAFGPYIAHLYHRGQLADLRRTYAAATSWIVRLSLPAFVALLVFPDHLLRLFGGGFRAGATVTVLLALGKLVDAATGPCGLMLNMSGRPALNMMDNVGVLVLNIALNLWLIPAYGIIGAAVAWMASLCVVNAARLTQVWWIMRILPLEVGVLKGLLAGAGAAVVAILVRLMLPESRIEALVGLAAIAVSYLGLVVALGITADDRMLVHRLVRRLHVRPA